MDTEDLFIIHSPEQELLSFRHPFFYLCCCLSINNNTQLFKSMATLRFCAKKKVEVVADMKLTQLSKFEFKLDAVEAFCLSSDGNCMVLIGNSNDITVFELMTNCNTMILMPYSNKQIAVSQVKPISEVIKNINLVRIYETATVQESQELALDPIYTADCATENLKARVLQASIINKHGTYICCILTSYGYCEIFKKAEITEEWIPLDTNLSNILLTEIFPSKILHSNIKTYNDLKAFANKYIITCFFLYLHFSELLIFLGTAAGYIICLKYNEISGKFENYCNLKTSLNRITYISVCDNIILVGCEYGKVLLVKMNFENGFLEELDYLWNKLDRMSCRKAAFTYNKNSESYYVVFCKAAHILAFHLDLAGSVISRSTLYVSGIKITGIESISENEFIITTIMGSVKYIKILSRTNAELQIEEQVVDHKFDSTNYQILGLAASSSKNLWSFLLYRNKEYLHQSKYSANSAFINVCKLSTQDSFVKLTNFTLGNMNMAQDLVLAINLDIFNNMEIHKYMNYLNLECLKFPDEINDEFLRRLQIKIIITRKLATYQIIKYKRVRRQTKIELQILEPALQMLHILGRLSYLKQLNLKEIQFTNFQELSIACMQLQFSNLLNKIEAIKSENDAFHRTVEKFVKYFMNEFGKNKFHNSLVEPTEYCMMCNAAIKDFVKCEKEHEIKRCTISCTQLTLFKAKYCPLCYALARNDDEAKLREIYSTDELITCIYCGFLLKQEKF